MEMRIEIELENILTFILGILLRCLRAFGSRARESQTQ